MARCTWTEGDLQCGNMGTEPQVGRQWALLCLEHHERLDNAIKLMMACWVKASGGAKKMVERIWGPAR